LKQRSKLKMRRKRSKKTLSDEPTNHQCIASEHLVHCATTRVNLIPSDEPMILFIVASVNWRREAAKTAASDEPTIHWREPSVYPVVKFEQDRDAPR
jgi:hypothetical protein